MSAPKIHFWTRLTLAQPYINTKDGNIGETWGHIPRVDEFVEFLAAGREFALRVGQVVHIAHGQRVEVELCMPRWFASVDEWEGSMRTYVRVK